MTVQDDIQAKVKAVMQAFPGIGNELIARKTGYSVRTVSKYRSRIIAEWMNAEKDGKSNG